MDRGTWQATVYSLQGCKELDMSNWAHMHETETIHIDAFDCGAGEDSWQSLGQQGDQTSQSQRKLTINVHSKDWC